MSRQDRLAADLERGFSALEAGELEDAAAAVERCQRIDRKRPEVIALAAAVADANSDVDTALGLYRSLIELTPDDPMPRICAARLELRDLGNPDAALDTVDAAFDYIDEERDLVEAITIRAEALIATDDIDSAREALAELSTSVIDDPELAFDLAELALAAEDPSAAARWIEIARKPVDGGSPPGIEADALHLLGRIHEATESRAEMIAAWQQVRALDLAAPEGSVVISEEEVEQIAVRTLAELPADVRNRLDNVPILIDDVPSVDLVAEGTDPRSLGLFQGTPMPDGGDGGVTTIHLFRKNLERVSVDLDQLAEEVRITVLHETAHYFGLDEDDLERLGLD